MKPKRDVWEETWTHDGDGVIESDPDGPVHHQNKPRFHWEQGCCFGAFGALEGPFNPEPRDQQRATLAAAAPELARALVGVEWVDDDGEDSVLSMMRCPGCLQPRLLVGGAPEHRAGCRIDAALTKAGLDPAAREKLRASTT